MPLLLFAAPSESQFVHANLRQTTTNTTNINKLMGPRTSPTEDDDDDDEEDEDEDEEEE